MAHREGGKVGLLKALVVPLNGADGARPRLLQRQDTLRGSVQLLALHSHTLCSAPSMFSQFKTHFPDFLACHPSVLVAYNDPVPASILQKVWNVKLQQKLPLRRTCAIMFHVK